MTDRSLRWQLIGIVLIGLLLGGCSASAPTPRPPSPVPPTSTLEPSPTPVPEPTLDQAALDELLVAAVASDDIAEVERLLKDGADANAESKSDPVIIIAALRGNAEIVELLAEHGADINAQSNAGQVPIFGAVKRGHVAVVELLLDLGVDVNSRDHSSQTLVDPTVLIVAADMNQLQAAELLLERGADVNMTDEDGVTPLHEAAFNQDGDFIEFGKLLIDNGADINAVNSARSGNLTPLHNAAKYGSAEFAQLLIDEGAELNPKDPDGLTPLDHAIRRRNDETAQLLREAGATTNTPEDASDPPDNILFVGNSLTWLNDGIDYHMEQLAASANPPLVTETDMTGGGHKSSLELVWTWTDAVEMIGTGDFDLVVLQEDLPLTDVDTFFEFARKFDAEIKKSGADTVLLMHWYYEVPEPATIPRLYNPITIEEIAQAHRDLATELGAEVAPVGLAWQRAMEERPEVDLYNANEYHPSIYGTYLAANVMYATVLGKNPSGLAYLPPEGIYTLSNGETISGITEEEAAFLQRIAWETVQEYQAQQ